MTPGNSPTESSSAQQNLSIERATWVRWHIVAILMCYSFMTWFNRVSMQAAGARIIEEGILSETLMGSVYSAFFFVYMLCMTPGGWVADRFGPWTALVVMGFGSAVFGACTGVVGLTSLSPTMLLVAFWAVRGLMGAFTAPIYPGSGRLISHWIPLHGRAWTNGLVQGMAAVGIASSYVIFGWLIARFGWPKAFVVTGSITAALAFVFAFYVTNWPRQHSLVNSAEIQLIAGRSRSPEIPSPNSSTMVTSSTVRGQPDPPPSAASDSSTGWLSLLRNRSLICLTLAYAAVGYFEYLFFFWVPYYFEKVLELGKTESQFYSGIPPLAMAVGMPLGGWLSDRFVLAFGYRRGRAIVPIGGMILSAVLLIAGVIAADRQAEPVWIVTWFSLALGAIGAVEGPTWATAIELGGRHGATAAGICNTGGNAGGTLAPFVTPWVGTTFGWNYAMLISCVVCLAGVGLWWWVDPEEKVIGNR